MPIASERYSKKTVNRAGAYLRDVRRALRAPSEGALDAFAPTEFDRAVEVVEWWRGLHVRPLARVNAGLRYYVKKAAPAEEPQVSQRLKRFSTIVHKLDREPGMKLSTMEDIGGVRAILTKQAQVDDVVEMLERAERWQIRRLRRYVEGGDPGPKSDGYRAVHVIVVKDGCYIEIQLRTPWQDSWAQSVEQDTRRLSAELKFGRGPDDLREYYKLISDLFAMREALQEPSQEFMADLAKQYALTRRYFPEQPGQHDKP